MSKTLSEERKKLLKGFNVWTMNIDWLYEQIEKQDKQFIQEVQKELKEGLEDLFEEKNTSNKYVDKIFKNKFGGLVK